MLDRRPSIRLNSGNHFYFDDPAGSIYEKEDIASGLSKEARFNGQTSGPHPYVVAQHSVNSSYIVEPGFEWEAFHHDDMEAFYKDVTTWLKRMCPDYVGLLTDAERQHSRRLGLPEHMSPQVKLADTQMLRLEKDALFDGHSTDEGFAFAADVIMPPAERLLKVDLRIWSAPEAYRKYLARWQELERNL